MKYHRRLLTVVDDFFLAVEGIDESRLVTEAEVEDPMGEVVLCREWNALA